MDYQNSPDWSIITSKLDSIEMFDSYFLGDNIFNPESPYIRDDVSETGPDNLLRCGDSVVQIKSTGKNHYELNNNLRNKMDETMIRGQEKERTHRLSDQHQNKELKYDYSFDEITLLSKFFESKDDYNEE